MKALCPRDDCGKTVTVVERAGGRWFSNHRRPPDLGGGYCPSGLAKVRIRDLLHLCVDCQALPVGAGVLVEVGGTKPNGPDGPEYRPAIPRPASGRPPRCYSHHTRHLKALKAGRLARKRERGRGISEEDRWLLWAAQGEACACCGHRLNVEKRAPSLDHCHTRAAEHDHPDDQACRRCARGLLCFTCNRWVAGRDSEPSSLLGQYKAGHNPAARLGWWDGT